MFVTNKRIKAPKDIQIGNSRIQVVDNFKLLGVTIDNQLKFDMFTSEIRNTIVKKMYSIKKLFYLSTSVKIQFFKTFLLPYFDYCSSLAIYYVKTANQRMCNCYNYCLFKLFKFKNESKSNEELNNYNNFLEKYGLSTFEHRLLMKFSVFIHRIVNNISAPTSLKERISKNDVDSTDRRSTLRKRTQNPLTHKVQPILSRHHNAVSEPSITSRFGERTFDYFFSKLINNIITTEINESFRFFRTIVFNNINLLFLKFIGCSFFKNFDLMNKNLDYLTKTCKS